jgi:shikimate dehydrogenase
MHITGKTRVVGIFGDPVRHSLSPVIQNAAFAALGLDFVYVPFHVKPEGLKAAVEAIRAMEMAGVNVTIPHKEGVLGYLDELDPHARVVGAVNTIVLNRDNRLVGYNTDGLGYLKSLKEETGLTPEGKNVLVAGAGGAARSILFSVLSGGAKKAVVMNRTVERAASLADEFAEIFPDAVLEAVSLERSAGEKHAPEADLLVNTTSLGMEGKNELDFPVEKLAEGAVVSDIVYSPLETNLLKGAAARGLKTHNGLSMLVAQGAVGFELWTGCKAPVEEMKAAAREALGL